MNIKNWRLNKAMDIKKRLQNLVIKIDALKEISSDGSPGSTEYNTGVTKARDLVIGEISKVNCNVCRVKEYKEMEVEV